MRKDTVTTKVYEFNELSDDAKQKALEELWDIDVDYDWWDCTYEDAAQIGLEITGFDLDRGSYVRGNWTEYTSNVASRIIEEHGESCETHIDAKNFQDEVKAETIKFEAKDDYDPEYEEFEDTEEYGDLADEFLRTICEDYRIMLQKEYEYLTSNEAIIETIESNEYEFTADGNLY